MNYPLARDARQQVHWARGKDSGRWQADLPGENLIQAWFAAGTPKGKVRLATGFDVNVLNYLLRQVQITKMQVIVIPSVSGLLNDLGLVADNKARQHVARAFDLWQRITLRYDHWHEPRRGAGRRILRPPITRIDRDGRRIKVTINGDWAQLALSKSYYGKVPLPLPFAAGTQNLLLRLMTEIFVPVASTLRNKKTAERVVRPWRKPLALARKIGLQSHYVARLDAAFRGLKVWLKARGGDVMWGWPGDGTLNVGLVPASIARAKEGRTGKQRGADCREKRGELASKEGRTVGIV